MWGFLLDEDVLEDADATIKVIITGLQIFKT